MAPDRRDALAIRDPVGIALLTGSLAVAHRLPFGHADGAVVHHRR